MKLHGFLAIDDLLEGFEGAPAVYSHLVAMTSDQEAGKHYFGQGTWSIVEVVSHVRDTEMVALQRTKDMKGLENPLLLGFDQEEWAAKKGYINNKLGEVLIAFSKLREDHVQLLRSLGPEDWDRVGKHSEIGEITIYSHIVRMVAHDWIHAKQISDLVNKASTFPDNQQR